jgi:hypothetical protein
MSALSDLQAAVSQPTLGEKLGLFMCGRQSKFWQATVEAAHTRQTREFADLLESMEVVNLRPLPDIDPGLIQRFAGLRSVARAFLGLGKGRGRVDSALSEAADSFQASWRGDLPSQKKLSDALPENDAVLAKYRSLGDLDCAGAWIVYDSLWHLMNAPKDADRGRQPAREQAAFLVTGGHQGYVFQFVAEAFA